MRKLFATALLALAAAPLAGGSAAGVGTLAGQAQISYGCPGPMLEGGPSCNPWRPFAGARLSVARAGGTARVVVADGAGRFTLRLAAGSYTVTPLRQPRTKGGAPVQVRVRPGVITHVLVRFSGFPMMEAAA
jgi:hypothetical protein